MKAIWLNDAIHRKLKVEAFNTEMSMNNIAETAIEEYLDKRKAQVVDADQLEIGEMQK